MKLNTLKLFQPSVPDYGHYQMVIKQLSVSVDPNECFQCYEWLIHQITDLPMSQQESITLIVLCLNNLAIGLYRNELLAKKILKFARNNILKNGQLHCNQQNQATINYLININIAKIHFQLSNYSKAFLEAERALTLYEQIAFQKLKLYSQPNDAQILINGYMILGKAFELADRQELLRLSPKSTLLQNGLKDSSKFMENATKLALKYLGSNHPLSKKLKIRSNNQSVLQFHFNGLKQQQQQEKMDKRQIVGVLNLLKFLKQQIPIKKLEIDNRLQFNSTPQEDTRIKTEISQSRKLKIKRSYNTKQSIDEQTSDDTMKDTQRKFNKHFKIKSNDNIEQMINQKVEEKLKKHIEETNASNIQLDMKYMNLQQEINKIEQEKQIQEQNAKEWKSSVNQLQDEINQLKKDMTDNDKLNQEQNQQEQLKYQNHLRQLSEQNQQLQILLKQKNNYINEFQAQTDSQKNTPPFSFNKTCQPLSEEKSIMRSGINLGKNQYFNQKPHKSLSEASQVENEDILFQFVDNLSQQLISIVLAPQMSFKIKIMLELTYDLEINLIPSMSKLLKDFTLRISAQIEDKQIVESIDISQLSEYLGYTQNYHNLPYPVKMITDYKNFVQYLIVPFTQLYLTENQEYKIAFYPYAQGLTQEMNGVFFGLNCQLWVYYLSVNLIRITVYFNHQFILQFEFNFDSPSFAQYFQQIYQDEYQNYEADHLSQLIQLSETTQNYTELSKSKNEEQKYTLPCFSIKDKTEFNNFVIKSLNSLESQLKKIGIFSTQQNKLAYNITDIQNAILNQDLKVIQFRVQNQNSTLLLCYEQSNKTYLKLVNCFETHMPKGKKVFAEGLYEITEQMINSKFSIDIQKLDMAEKQLLYTAYSELFYLHTFSKELQEDDYDCYKENAICQNEQDFGGCYRMYYGDAFKMPITFTLIGSNDKPQFVRVDFFDESNLKLNGVLFHITQENWMKIKSQDDGKHNKKKKQLKYNKDFNIQGEFYISDLLGICGWNILLRQLLLSDDSQLFISNQCCIARLEQFLNWRTSVDFLKKID